MSDKKIKTAVILAAGKGTRLDKITKGEYPKPLTPIDGVPIIERSIQALIKQGVERILLGCGHMMESFNYLTEKYKEVEIVENPKYDELGSIYTLWVFREVVSGPFFLLEADILYDSEGLTFLGNGDLKHSKILTSAPVPLDDNVYYKSDQNVLQVLSKEPFEGKVEGAMTGIWALSEGFLKRFTEYFERQNISFNEDYETLMALYSKEKEPIMILNRPDFKWCEIDNEDHLEYAITKIWPEIRDKV
ncbi:MAG: phosphocholine cytidylyltransferase family protein [Balneola sp.]